MRDCDDQLGAGIITPTTSLFDSCLKVKGVKNGPSRMSYTNLALADPTHSAFVCVCMCALILRDYEVGFGKFAIIRTHGNKH